MVKTYNKVQENDLPRIAKDILNEIKNPVILFKGEMGAGKTTFIKNLLQEMGAEDEVSSPTYALVNEYQTPQGIVYHFDFYRIEDEEEAYDMGWEEYAYSGNLTLVEWPERIANLIPEKYHTLQIIKNDDDSRTIQFS